MRFPLLLPIAAAMLLGACNSENNLGSSLVTDSNEVIEDSTSFTLTGTTVSNTDIMSRTGTQMLGVIDATQYGTLRSDIVTQFMPTATLDTTNVSAEDVDSVKLLMFVENNNFTGDSLVPMGVKVYELNRQLPSPIFSSFDPRGYYNPGNILAQTVYTMNGLHNDSIASLDYRTITVPLPREFGVNLYKQYYSNPATFLTPDAFARWFPGVYISSSFGSGRVVRITGTRINVYYGRHMTVTDSLGVEYDSIQPNVCAYMAVTPEVISNNCISYTPSESITDAIGNGEQILAAPAGTDIEIKFPIKDMIEKFISEGGDLAVFNTLAITIPVEEIENNYGILPPSTLLMVRKDQREKFFAENRLTDNATSFYTIYDSTDNCYRFTLLRGYFMEMLRKYKNGEELTEEDATFTLTPIEVTTTQVNQYSDPTITGMHPYCGAPVMARLMVDNTKIKFIYSRQNIIF